MPQACAQTDQSPASSPVISVSKFPKNCFDSFLAVLVISRLPSWAILPPVSALAVYLRIVLAPSATNSTSAPPLAKPPKLFVFLFLAFFLVGDSCCWQKRPHFPGAGTVTADCRDQQIAIFPHAHRPTCPSSRMLSSHMQHKIKRWMMLIREDNIF